ncbi:class II fructose-bisphosphate aldolase [Streptomyces lunaelactis]|uniref:class II fructose-bisphosphate aldolase n=1 Tax=Streptomyces lunaelactis TaxID=1535768 RepID=UPI001585233D|nr:class II fructose-bisphosphate aldolase [Streptomyces lunaelactis]NUK04563.1 class II fructose-bisphosphate aldolase [Streptomyces lunaelactis]NUK11806.1 class II fructose-bisphosphate aldolase [Streptomyces lunaelactis]NUK19463.1 class II fructose-bisphosphate aldolase [Streptomyces lunaelactis]NUK26425.1 class II fructose-bisphosphate aldolase [Streptomyces lunaelactis]NUK37752.1 class II fructose-bisphosphate aldolase [Streptomyces lunaelactis]
MPLVSTGELVSTAVAEGRGVAAFNVITLEHAEAIAAGAEQAGAPAILQISENAVKFHGGRLSAIAAAASAVARASSARLSLHLDHVVSADLLRAADAEGFSSVMFDASKLPYDENVKATADAVRWGHERGIWIEAELGKVGGKEGEAPLDAHTPGVRTDPSEAAAYVAATGVDALAVAVGSSHAMTERTAALDHTLISALRATVPVPLVLHGSSGVPDAEIRKAVTSGMTKINVGTALNTAFTGAVRTFLDASPSTVDPRKYLVPARTAMAGTVAGFLGLL